MKDSIKKMRTDAKKQKEKARQEKEREQIENQFDFLNQLDKFITENVDGLGTKSVPIPTFLGIPKQTFNDRMDKGRFLFTFTDLTVFYRNLFDKYTLESDERFKEVADWVLARIVIDFLATLGVRKSTIRGILDRDTTLLEMKTAQSVFITISFESGASEIITQENLKETLHILLHPLSHIKQLHLTVFEKDMAKTIEIVQEWAFSEKGNFQDQLDVQIYAREHQPIAETIAFVIDGEFHARMYNGEGFVEMLALGEDLLESEMNALNNEMTAFELPTSPEGRVVEWINHGHKTAGDAERIAEEIIEFLRQKVGIFENKTDYISRSVQEWDELFDSCVKDVQKIYDVDIHASFEFIGMKLHHN